MASRLERLIRIEKVIRTGNFPDVSDLCNMFEIQPRTLFLDIKVLRENLGYQIKFDRMRRGYYSASPEQKLPSFSLTEEEHFILVIAAELFAQVSGFSIAAEVHIAIGKITQGCFPNWDDKGNPVNSIIRATSPDKTDVSLSKLRSLYQACVKAHLIIVVANHMEDQSREIIEPHYLEHTVSRWFLVGYSRDTKQIFHRALDSITNFEMTNIPFERRPDLLLP